MKQSTSLQRLPDMFLLLALYNARHRTSRCFGGWGKSVHNTLQGPPPVSSIYIKLCIGRAVSLQNEHHFLFARHCLHCWTLVAKTGRKLGFETKWKWFDIVYRIDIDFFLYKALLQYVLWRVVVVRPTHLYMIWRMILRKVSTGSVVSWEDVAVL